MAVVGDQLTTPESGWRRYDDTHVGLNYTGTWTTPSPTNTGYYGGSIRVTSRAVDNNYVTFSFFGTKLRIISDLYSDRHSDNAITIDGVTETYSAFRAVGSPSIQQAIVYEKTGLPLAFHTVTIATGHNRINFTLDAIDIDETGYLYGYTLTAPEPEWKRYDTDNNALYFGTDWKTVANNTGRVFEGGSTRYSNVIGNYIKFSFTGKKIRLIAEYGSLYDPNVEVSIDGVVEYINLSTTSSSYQPQRLVLEKINLSEGIHEVVVKKISGTGNFHIDAVDIDVTGRMIRLLGSQLTTPDEGWKRYDDSVSSIKYIGSFANGVGAGAYNGYSNYTSTIGDKIVFDFEGTKLRLVGARYTNRSDLIEVYVDGKLHGTHSQLGSELAQVLQVEIIGLQKAKHRIEMVNKSSGSTTTFMALDAVDIDSDGRLFHPDEVTSITDLEIGKRMRCHYIAARNSVGVFSRLGEETFDLIGSGNPTPMGDFYWIMVEDWNKRKFLVADRNIQNTISWDTINKEGYVFGAESTTISKTLNKTPYLTSASSDVYSVTGVGNSLSGEDPWRAFASAGFWGSYAGTGLILDCKRKVKFGEIKVTAYYGANMASVIDVYGSDNNVDYTLIKSCQKSSWSDSEQATFYFDQPVEYRYYKIMKTTQVSGSNAARLNLELSYSEKVENNHIFKLRLLTGGINSADADNEWNKYIVNSTLNGTITAGDNNVWNWSGISSYSSTSSASSTRSQRGNGTASGYGAVASSSANTTSGFRPVMEIEVLPMDRSFINHEGFYKKYVPNEFIESNDNAIPVMTSNTSPSGIASASSINSASFDAYQAFNGIQDARYGWVSLTPVSWLQYQFPAKKIIYKYSLAMRTNGTYYATGEPPNTWTFEGSKDGVNWIVLDTRTNNMTLARGSVEEYRINNSDAFTYYRVNVSANQGNATITVIAELKMFEKTPKGEVVGWNTISAILPSEDNFINDGMYDLSVLDRKNENFVQTMTANGSLGSGKLFKGSIDLKKYFEITSISAK